MIALFFEVLPKPGHEGTYLEMAAKLKPALDESGGLLFLDRSRSAIRPGWFLSHQFWRDEAAMVRWRAHPAHHRVQACSRTDVLTDYRLRVAQVTAHATAGSGLVEDAMAATAAYNDPAVTPERFMVSILARAGLAVAGGETFASVYDEALRVHVIPVAGALEGHEVLARASRDPATLHARLCLVSRDYGLHDRREAPHYFEPVSLA